MLKNRHMFKGFSKEIVISHSYCVRGPVVQQLCRWSVLSTVLATSMSILMVCGWDFHPYSSTKNGPSTYYQRGQSKVALGLTLLYQEKAMLALFPAPSVTSRCLESALNLALPLTVWGGHMLYDLAAIPSPFLSPLPHNYVIPTNPASTWVSVYSATTGYLGVLHNLLYSLSLPWVILPHLGWSK